MVISQVISETSAPIRRTEVFLSTLSGNYDRQTDRPTNRPTNQPTQLTDIVLNRKGTLQIIEIKRKD